MAETDSVKIEPGQLAHRFSRGIHVAGKEAGRQIQPVAAPLQRVGYDEHALVGEVQADAAGCVSGRVNDTRTAQQGQKVAVVQRVHVRDDGRMQRGDRRP